MANPETGFDLIVTIVPKGRALLVLDASREAGARGGTVFPARGAGIREQKKVLGIPIEPEKDVVFTLVPQEDTDRILEAIIRATDLDKPGHGIAFVLDVKRVVGMHTVAAGEQEHAPR